MGEVIDIKTAQKPEALDKYLKEHPDSSALLLIVDPADYAIMTTEAHTANIKYEVTSNCLHLYYWFES